MEKEGKRLRIRATKGVVLAAGGFPHNQAMREKYQKHPVNTRWTVASPGNTGEVIEMGINAGAAVDLMDDNWGMPTVLPPDKSTFPLVMERSYPGAIMVNAAGRRFTNEAAPYLDVVHPRRPALDYVTRVPAHVMNERGHRGAKLTDP